MTEEESQRMAASLTTCGNAEAVKFILFALETAMRKGEALWTACWCDVDYDNRVLTLPHAKTGRREVPLSPQAIAMLQAMPQGAPTASIFHLTQGALDSAWKRACEDAGVINLHIHDLRHTSATMWAELLNGDIFKLKEITGHRTLKMLQRYVNPTARQVANQLHTIETPTLSATMRLQMASAQSKSALASKAKGRPIPPAVVDESTAPTAEFSTAKKVESQVSLEEGVNGNDSPQGNVFSFAAHRAQKQRREVALLAVAS